MTFVAPVSALEVKPYLITDAFETNVPSGIRTYFYKTIQVNYQSGKVVLSLNPDGTGDALVGESIHIVVNPGSGYFETITINPNCSLNKIPPLDITHLLYKGTNGIRVGFRTECGPGLKKHDQLYLVHFDDYEQSTEPFLDLPWDYTGKGQTFEDAAISMSSYFDHEYPLLSIGYTLPEPQDTTATIISYLGGNRNIEKSYSAHDGYDYAFESNVKLNDPVLAAANGVAKFINSCGACGNAIHIDHGNGYQTRYYHLQPDELIIDNPNNSIVVDTHQKIGKVGFSGNVKPIGTDGAHIHFMVVHDKNGDGNFEDNIPDGLIDPYGWQSYDPDPWQNYSFQLYGLNKTGAKSYYLWKNKISGLIKTLPPEGGKFTTNRHELTFPNNFINKYLILKMTPTGVTVSNESLQSIGQGIDVTLKDGFNNFYTQFQKLFTIKYKFSSLDTTRLNQDSISMYSSIDGINWEKESTTIDWSKLEATSQTNHLTQFALLGEKLDSIAPVTQILLSGTETLLENELETFNSPVTVSFISLDEPTEYSLGIDYTMYQINEGEWQKYEHPITFSEFNSYNINFYSIDKDGNAEETKSSSFEIKEEIMQQLEFQIIFDTETEQILVKPLDPKSEVTYDQIQIKKKSYNRYTAKNGANKTTLITYTPDRNERDILKFYSLQYNENEPHIFTKNKYIIFNKKNKKDVEKLIQIFQHEDDERIRLTYNNIKDITNVVTKMNGQPKLKTVENGFKKLIIKTQNGELVYQIE